jgi:putative glutamine amidotransferase
VTRLLAASSGCYDLFNMQTAIEDRVRVGIPYRTIREEIAGEMRKHETYCRAVREAGGEPVPIPLRLDSAARQGLFSELDAFVLPGSPADVDPALYNTPRNPKSAEPDPQREQTDFAICKHAFSVHKPILAICYGVQSLNVFLGGTLVQDIPTEIVSALQHAKHPSGETVGAPKQDPHHEVRLEPGTMLAEIAHESSGEAESKPGYAIVNSSHHQAVRTLGRGLRASAISPDKIIEAFEWIGAEPESSSQNSSALSDWVVGVQWHPERMPRENPGGIFAAALFRALVRAASGVAPQAT